MPNIMGEFQSTYTNFQTFYKSQSWTNCVNLILYIPSKDIPPKHYNCYEFLITASISVMQKTSFQNPKYTMHLCKCFLHLLTITATYDIHAVLEVVKNLGRISTAASFLCDCSAKFYREIGNFIVNQCNNVDIINENLLLSLAKCFTVLVKMEMASNLHDLVESRTFLKNLQHAMSAHKDFFKLIDLCMMVCQNEVDAVQLELALKKINTATISSTEIDVLSIVSQIYQSCVPQIIKSGLQYNIMALLSISVNLIEIFTQTTIAPSLYNCNYCKENILPHEIINVCEVTMSLLLRHAISKTVMFDKNLLTLCVQNILEVEKLNNCQALSIYKTRCAMNISNLLVFFYNSSQLYASYGIHMIQMILETFQKHTNISHTNYLPGNSIFKYLQTFYECDAAADVKQTIRIGYLNGIFILQSQPLDEQKMKLAMYNLCTIQSKLTEIIPIRTYLEEINWKYMGVVDIPSIELIDLLLQQLYYASSSWNVQLKLKLIEHIFAEKSSTPAKCLQCLYAFDDQIPTTEIIMKLKDYYAMTKKSAEHLQGDDMTKWYSISATMYTLEYLYEFIEISKKYKNQQLHLKAPETVFRDLNVNIETKMFQKLVGAIKSYRKFIANLNAKTCMTTFKIEIEHGLIYLRKVALHLTVRDFFKEAMAAYMALYTLAQKADDKFGKIHAVSYFAANSRDYPVDRKNPATLDAIISHSSEILVATLTTRKTLSFRKQCHILYCMINIALYTMEQGKTEEAQNLMEFADTMLVDMEQQFTMAESNAPRIRYYSVLLIFITKHNVNSPFAPILFAEYILTACKSIQYVLAEDSIIFPIQLYETMIHVTEYSLSRYDYVEIEVILQMLLKLAMRMGLALKMAKLLALNGLVDLYKEDYENCVVKLNCLDDILGIFDAIKSGNNGLPQELRKKQEPYLNVSPIRNLNGLCISPIRVMKAGIEIPFSKYLIKHDTNCNCLFCKNIIYKELLFEVAILYCRSFYIKKEFETCLISYEHLYQYWSEHLNHKEFAEIRQNGDKQFETFAKLTGRMCWYYSQSLWRDNQINKAIQKLDEARYWLSKCFWFDNGMDHDIEMQQCFLDDILNLSESEFNSNSLSNTFKDKVDIKMLLLIGSTAICNSELLSAKNPMKTNKTVINKTITSSSTAKSKKTILDKEPLTLKNDLKVRRPILQKQSQVDGVQPGAQERKPVNPAIKRLKYETIRKKAPILNNNIYTVSSDDDEHIPASKLNKNKVEKKAIRKMSTGTSDTDLENVAVNAVASTPQTSVLKNIIYTVSSDDEKHIHASKLNKNKVEKKTIRKMSTVTSDTDLENFAVNAAASTPKSTGKIPVAKRRVVEKKKSDQIKNVLVETVDFHTQDSQFAKIDDIEKTNRTADETPNTRTRSTRRIRK